MAKAKKRVKRKVSKKSKPKRTINMATKKRRTKRRSTSVRRTLSSPAPRRRRKRSLGDSAKKGIMTGFKNASGGALGGALFTGTRLVEMPFWIRAIVGYGGAVGIAMVSAKAANVSAGMAGATTYYLLDKFVPGGLLHDDMQDADYVDADSLSDSGYMDESGNAILCDGEGILYQLNDSNELEAIGDIYSLNDDYDLQDAYQLAAGF